MSNQFSHHKNHIMGPSIFRHIAACSLMALLLIGSAAYSYAISVHKTELAQNLKLEVFVNDAAVIEVPTHKVGFHTFVYQLDAGIRKEIIPVANAPPIIVGY